MSAPTQQGAASAVPNSVAPFPSRGGSGFRFSGTIGQAHMDNVHSFAFARYARERDAKAAQSKPGQTIELTRTPALALVMAVLDALPQATRRRALRSVMAMGDTKPDCEASRAAAWIASALMLKDHQ